MSFPAFVLRVRGGGGATARRSRWELAGGEEGCQMPPVLCGRARPRSATELAADGTPGSPRDFSVLPGALWLPGVIRQTGSQTACDRFDWSHRLAGVARRCHAGRGWFAFDRGTSSSGDGCGSDARCGPAVRRAARHRRHRRERCSDRNASCGRRLYKPRRTAEKLAAEVLQRQSRRTVGTCRERSGGDRTTALLASCVR
jgi:hypothetical protein